MAKEVKTGVWDILLARESVPRSKYLLLLYLRMLKQTCALTFEVSTVQGNFWFKVIKTGVQ